MTSDYTCILFDLDGTIMDSAPGITSSLAWAFEQLGYPVPAPTELVRFVGPPILDGFRDIGGLDEEQSQRMLEIYRPHYLQTGAFDARVFPGMERVLNVVGARGIPMSLATSKPETPTKAILKRFDLTHHFTFLGTASDDEVRSAKADVVAFALEGLRAADVDTTRPLMIGDRHHDVEGAAEHGVPTIVARWGYGAPAEEVGAIGAADDADELLALMFDETAAA